MLVLGLLDFLVAGYGFVHGNLLVAGVLGFVGCVFISLGVEEE